MYFNNTQPNYPQQYTQGAFFPNYYTPMQMMQQYAPSPLCIITTPNRYEESETVDVKEYSGKLYVEEENCRPHLVLDAGINKIFYVRPDKLYNHENFYIVAFRSIDEPVLIFEKDYLDVKKFLTQLEMGCHKQVRLYKKSGRRTAELLRNYFSSKAEIAEIKFYCGWIAGVEGWQFRLANGKTHGTRPLDLGTNPNALKPALDVNKDIPYLDASAELFGAERFVTMMETIQSAEQRSVIFLWLHISALYSLLEGLGFRFPLGFCLFTPRVNPYQIMKKLLEWYGDSPISLSDKKDCLLRSIVERKDQPLFLCDNGENSNNISTLIQLVQTGNVSQIPNSEAQAKLQAPLVVLTNAVSPILVSSYFFTLDLSTAEFTENAFETVSSLHRYLPDYFVRFSSFIEKNIDLLREALNRGMRTALSLADEWEISDDGCTSLGIFYGVAELVSEYYNNLRPQPDLAVRMNRVLGENWDDFLRQVFQNNADCRGNYSDLATIFMAVARENLLRGNFEKRSRDGKPLNVYESTGSDGVVYMDDQFCYFTRKAFSSVCKACDASGPMVIHALRIANLLHGQSVNASTVMTRITTYDVYGCIRTERVYKIRREDIAEANVNINCYQGGLR